MTPANAELCPPFPLLVQSSFLASAWTPPLKSGLTYPTVHPASPCGHPTGPSKYTCPNQPCYPLKPLLSHCSQVKYHPPIHPIPPPENQGVSPLRQLTPTCKLSANQKPSKRNPNPTVFHQLHCSSSHSSNPSPPPSLTRTSMIASSLVSLLPPPFHIGPYMEQRKGSFQNIHPINLPWLPIKLRIKHKHLGLQGPR